MLSVAEATFRLYKLSSKNFSGTHKVEDFFKTIEALGLLKMMTIAFSFSNLSRTS